MRPAPLSGEYKDWFVGSGVSDLLRRLRDGFIREGLAEPCPSNRREKEKGNEVSIMNNLKIRLSEGFGKREAG